MKSRQSWSQLGTLIAAVFSVGAVTAGVTLAVGWVDVGDSTCGALYRPDIWRDSDYCSEIMGSRLLTIGALGAAVSMSMVAVAAIRAWARGTF